jgi:hypothetical protein
MEKHAEQRPRVEQKNTENASEPLTASSHPRVSFREQIATYIEPRQVRPTRMIVVSPHEPVVVSPKPWIFKPPKSDEEPDTIATRLKARKNRLQIVKDPPEETIADRVARRRQEAAANKTNPVLDQETGKLLKYQQLLRHPKHKEVWNRSAADKFGRLAQGIGGRVKGTDTVRFIHNNEVSADRFKDVTYIKFVCRIITEKKDPYRTRASMGGNLINYPDDMGTPTTNLLLIKIFLNSVISMPGAWFANADISNLYLMTTLKRPEYAKVKLSDIPEEVIQEYKLCDKVTPDGFVYMMVVRRIGGVATSCPEPRYPTI